MNSGLYTAFSGMQAQLNALEILSNNLANINTTAFKEEKAFFAYLSQSLENPQGSGDLNETINRQVRALGALNGAGGSLNATNRDLDIAIEGNGFLVIKTPRGIRYTRNGSLHLNPQSVLTTSDGDSVLGTNGRPITLAPGKVHINTEGEVSLDEAPVNRLKIVSFANLSMLEKEGNSLFVPRAGHIEEKVSDAKIKSGYLEQSNVSPVTSIIQMVEILRHFEAIQKSVNLVMNDMNAKVIDKLGK